MQHLQPTGKIDLNADWRFARGNVKGAASPDFDDSAWRVVQVPHDWSIEGPFDETNPSTSRGAYLPNGFSWYRRRFKLPAELRGRRVYVHFDGVYMNARVWVNGRPLGIRPNGYVPFFHDITEHLVYAETENVLAVQADGTIQPGSRWYTGAGIYRDVWLDVADAVHIAPWGIGIATPTVSAEEAVVAIETTVRNSQITTESVRVGTTIVDLAGRTVAECATDAVIDPGSDATVTARCIVTTPALWSIETPSLYTAVTEVIQGGQARHQRQTSFGIRSIGFDPSRGFLLNGKRVELKGVCLHHDCGCLGAAAWPRAEERKLELMKAMGANAVRTSHNPSSARMLDLCDQMGLLVMDEAFDEWLEGKAPMTFRDGERIVRIPIYGYSHWFAEWSERDLRDMIRRDRNHPSIIMWSVGNEILDQRHHIGVATLKELMRIAHDEDPTRPVTVGCNGTAEANASGFTDLLDVAGYNYHERLYEEDHAHWPDRVICGSENTSHPPFLIRGTYDLDAMRDEGDDRVRKSEESMRITKALDYVCGLFIWTGIDYLGEPTPHCWPSRSSYFGPVDLAALPKDDFYWYQAMWRDEPVLHLLPHWNWEPHRDTPVWAYTNCDEAELFLNGRSLGRQRFTDDGPLHLAWLVVYEPGELRAVGYRAGREVCAASRVTAGAPAAVRLTADRDQVSADGRDLAYVTADIVDANGNIVPTASHHVTFAVDGNATVIAVDNGDPTYVGSLQANGIPALAGRCIALVQSGVQAGTVKVAASADGLTDGAAVFEQTRASSEDSF